MEKRMIKKTHKKDGYVLAFAIVILGVILTLTAIMLSLNTLQFSNTQKMEDKIKNQIIAEQIEEDFLNRQVEDFKTHILSLGAECEIENTKYILKNKIEILIEDNFNFLKINEISTGKTLKQVSKT